MRQVTSGRVYGLAGQRVYGLTGLTRTRAYRLTRTPANTLTRLPIFLFAAFLLLLACGHAFAEVKLKVAVVNPSSTEKQTSPIRYDLPKGMGPDQIVDIGDLEMKFDFEKNVYYLAGNVELEPSERKILEVRLRDLWAIPPKELTQLKEHAVILMQKLKDTKHFQAGEALSKEIQAQLDGMIQQGKNETLPIKDRINQYYEDRVVLNGIKENTGMLENLVLDIGGVVEERVQIPETLAIPIADTQKDGPPPAVKTLELKVKATNPSQTLEMIAPVKFLLPVEVSPRYILSRSELDMSYDFAKEAFCLYKDDVELAPGETKEFVVQIQDVWRIERIETDALKAHTHNIMVLLEGSEYYNRAKLAADKIHANMDLIVKTQDAKVPAKEHIAYYRDNMKLLRAAKQEVAELERLVSQRGISVGVTVKWPEAAGGGAESQRKRGFEGVNLIAQSIFRGKAPTIATTWKIIFSVIGFLGIISFVTLSHYAWRRKVTEFDPLTGVYRRDSFTERCQEMLDRCHKENVQAAFFLLDLDKFKLANDKFGHAFGDRVLKDFVGVLRSLLRQDDVIGRYGGDEFAIAMTFAERSKVEEIAEKIREGIAKHTTRIKLTNQEFHLSSSIGVALYPTSGQNLASLLISADAAMYRSKSAGGNSVNFA